MRRGARQWSVDHRALRLGAAGRLILLLSLAPAVGAAHTRSTAYSDWTDDRVELQVSRLDWTALGALTPGQLPKLVRRDGCAPAEVREVPAREGWRRFEWGLRCEAPGAVRVDLLVEAVPGHVHVARVGGRERVLTVGARSTADPGSWVWLGVTHVLGGADHLVFVLALLLSCLAVREAAWAVSGFTVGHSVTLALAVTGRVAADPAVVEALIGLSIVLVAAENVFREAPRRWLAVGVVAVAAAGAWVTAPWVFAGMALFAACRFGWLAQGGAPLHAGLAALFGLVHGLGFAAVLLELAPRDEVWRPLLGFNVGVELGQLAVVLLAWPLLRWVRPWGSAAAAGAGMYWLVSRLAA